MEKHYITWFLLTRVYKFLDLEKFNFRPLQSKQTESCYVGFVSWTDAEAWAHVAEEEGM